MNWTCSDCRGIAELVERRAGIQHKPDQAERQETLISRAWVEEGFSTPQSFRKALETDGSLFDRLVEVLTIGETFFFRHVEQFECIRNEILPEIQRVSGKSHVVRAWSAGCSTGEEPYSLAILFRQEGLGGRSRIVGTDISRQSLECARKATYRKWSLRGAGAASAEPYLQLRGDSYFLESAVRSSVDFRYLNLAQDLYPSRHTGMCEMDLIMCRNVLIYFGKEVVEAIAGRLFETLAPGGYLISGASDPFLQGYAPFERKQVGDVLVYRKPLQESRREEREAALDSPGPEQTAAPHWDYESAKVLVELPVPASEQEGVPAIGESHPLEKEDGGEEKYDSSGAERVFATGDYEQVARLTESHLDDEAAAVYHVRALANLDSAKAVEVSRELVEQHQFSAELHYLCAMLLMQLELDTEAEEMLRRYGYIDGQSPLTYFGLGALRQRGGDVAGARTFYQKTLEICRGLEPDAVIPLSENETAERLAGAAQAQLGLLGAQAPLNQNGGSNGRLGHES